MPQWIASAAARIHTETESLSCDGNCETRKQTLEQIIASEYEKSGIAAHVPPATETGRCPIPMYAAQFAEIEKWAESNPGYPGDMWGSYEVRKINLTTFARSLLAHVPPAGGWISVEERRDDRWPNIPKRS